MRRTVVVGDIHGCFDELAELVELLVLVDLRPDDVLVSVGDVVDRGPKPGEVVDFFRGRPNSIVAMGNHERKHVRGIFSYAQEITRPQLDDRYDDAKPVAFGHHVTGREPRIRDGRIFGLDTGACHGWNLTALCVPGLTVHSVAARADHWSIAKRRWQLPVLKTKPWQDFTWTDLTESVGRFGARADPDTRSWLAAVEEWAARLRSSFPALLAAATRVAAELSPEELRRHAAAPLLFQARNGRLDEAGLTRQCPTPGRTAELVAALGLATQVPEFPR